MAQSAASLIKSRCWTLVKMPGSQRRFAGGLNTVAPDTVGRRCSTQRSHAHRSRSLTGGTEEIVLDAPSSVPSSSFSSCTARGMRDFRERMVFAMVRIQ